MTATGAALWALQVLAVFLAATVVFDAVHWTLHRLSRTRHPLLRRIAGLHETHHAWFDRHLQHDDRLRGANLRRHVIPEYATHTAVSALCAVWFPAEVVLAVWGLQTLVFAWIVRSGGEDVNHRRGRRARGTPPLWFCLPDYHRLHHVHPEAHFSSWVRTFDHLAGTGLHLAGRRVVVSGRDERDAERLADALAGAGAAVTWLPDDAGSAAVERELARADVLALIRPEPAPASRLVERLCSLARGRVEAPEVWSVAAGREFRASARRYWADRDVVYRHLTGGLGHGRAARTALFLLRRGLHYVPTSLRAALAYPGFRLAVLGLRREPSAHAPIPGPAPPGAG